MYMAMEYMAVLFQGVDGSLEHRALVDGLHQVEGLLQHQVAVVGCRLHQGFVRSTADGHPSGAASAKLNAATSNPESYKWVMVIPQSEFDGNANMDAAKDQNPFD